MSAEKSLAKGKTVSLKVHIAGCYVAEVCVVKEKVNENLSYNVDSFFPTVYCCGAVLDIQVKSLTLFETHFRV